MAAAVASALVAEAGLGHRVSVESFGTAGYHVGEGADGRADAALRRHGWPAGGHRARRIGADDVAALDLILCADRANLEAVRGLAARDGDRDKIRLLRSYDPEGGDGAEVPDPWGCDDRGFDEALSMIERSCRGLIAELAAPPG